MPLLLLRCQQALLLLQMLRGEELPMPVIIRCDQISLLPLLLLLLCEQILPLLLMPS